jgi:hypothetical protein
MYDEKVTSFFHADDIAIIADSSEHLQSMLNTCSTHARQLGYQYAPTKCKIVAPPNTVVTMDGAKIENVSNFTYLGVPIGQKGVRGDLFAKATAAKANRTIGVLRSIGLNGSGFSMKVKIRMIQTIVRPRTNGKDTRPTIATSSQLRTESGIFGSSQYKLASAASPDRVRATERFVDRAVRAGPNHLKAQAWRTHRTKRVGHSIFNRAEKMPRIKMHIPNWERGIPLPPEPESTKRRTLMALWDHNVVSCVQPRPRQRPKVNLRILLNGVTPKEQGGQPTPCTEMCADEMMKVEGLRFGPGGCAKGGI